MPVWKDLPLPVALFENEDFFALNKPAGLPSERLSSDLTAPCAVNWALQAFPQASFCHPNSLLEQGLLHRLDPGTSGVLLFAKTEKAWHAIRHLWKQKPQVIQKKYRALATFPPRSLLAALPRLIEIPLGHDRRSAKKMKTLPPARLYSIRGKPLPARTWIHEVKPVQNPQNTGLQASLLGDYHLEIETGFRHQIRCHLAAAGLPLLGDSLYGGLASSRLWLHAWQIQLPGIPLIEAPLPLHWPKVKPEQGK